MRWGGQVSAALAKVAAMHSRDHVVSLECLEELARLMEVHGPAAIITSNPLARRSLQSAFVPWFPAVAFEMSPPSRTPKGAAN
jgi:membrane glycosyltransferase